MAFDLSSFIDKFKGFFSDLKSGFMDLPITQFAQQYNSWDPTMQNIYQWFENLNSKTNNAYSGVMENLANYFNNKDFIGLQGYLSSLQPSGGSTYNFFEDMPQLESWMNNSINQQITSAGRSWEQEMRDTEYTSIANQLKQLGLSANSVLQSSGASHNAVSSPGAASRNQIDLRRYNEQNALAKSLLSMTSSMASAGVYGSAIGAARKASGVVASAASHSAYKALKHSRPRPLTAAENAEWDKNVAEIEAQPGSIFQEHEYPF